MADPVTQSPNDQGPMPVGQAPAQNIPAAQAAPDINAPMPGAQPSPPTPAARQVKVGGGAQPAPPPPGSFFSHLSHAFAGALLGGLAGKSEIESYHIDPDTGVQTPIYKTLHPRDQIAKLAGAALRGLAAGSTAESQPGNEALSGLGAGAAAETQFQQKQDLLKRSQAKDQFDTEQKAILQKHEIAHSNALTTGLYFQNMKAENDMTPVFGEYNSLVNAAKTSPELSGHVHEVTSEEVAEMQKNDPNFTSTHIIRPLGWAPRTGPDGQEIIDPKTQEPQRYMRMGIIDGTVSGKIPVTPEMAQNFHDYGDLARIPNYKSIKAGDTYQLQELMPYLNRADEARTQVLNGWAHSTLGWQASPDGKTQVPVEINALDPTRTRPFTPGVVPEEAKAAAAKTGLEGAQADEAKGKAQEALANAAMLFHLTGGNNDAYKEVVNSPEFKDQYQKMTPTAQAIVRTYHDQPATLSGLMLVGQGLAKLSDIFPVSPRPKAGLISAQQAGPLLPSLFPGWDENMFTNRQNADKWATVGKGGDAIRSINQFFVHSADALDASNALQRSNSPVWNATVNEVKNKYLGQPGVPELMTALTASRDEWGNLIKSGKAMTEDENKNKDILMNDASTVQQVAGVLGMMSKQAVGRIDPVNETYKSMVNGIPYPNLITPMGRAAAIKLGLADQIAPYKTGGALNQAQTPSISGAPDPSTHPNRLAADGKTLIFKMPDGTAQDATGKKYDPVKLVPLGAQ